MSVHTVTRMPLSLVCEELHSVSIGVCAMFSGPVCAEYFDLNLPLRIKKFCARCGRSELKRGEVPINFRKNVRRCAPRSDDMDPKPRRAAPHAAVAPHFAA